MSALYSSRCVFAAITAIGLLAGCVTYPELVPGSPPGAEFKAGYGILSDKAPTYGVTVGAFTPLKKAPSKIDYYSIELGVPTKEKLGDWLPKFEIKANFGSESTDSENSVGSRGQAFQGGFHGGTGGFASSAPSLSHVKTKYNEQSIAFIGQRPFGLFSQSDNSRISKEVLLSVARAARQYNGTLQYPAIPGLAGDEDQKVTSYRLGAGVGAFGTHLSDNGVTSTLGVRTDLNAIWGKYSGTHHYTSPLVGSVNSDFIQTTWDNRCALTWSGNAYGALGYRPNRNTEWGARFDYNYLGNGFALQNKVTPDDLTPRLYNSSRHSWGVTLGLRYGF